MSEALIQSYEDRLIAKDRTVCFYEMMQETYNFLKKDESLFKDHKQSGLKLQSSVDLICGFIQQGYNVKIAFKLANKNYDYYFSKLTLTQKQQIKQSRQWKQSAN